MPALPLSAEFLNALRSVVGTANVATGEAVALLNVGWNPHNLDAGVVVSPASTQEVAAIVRLCVKHGVSVVPQAGRTGLVGGSVSHPGEIVLSLLRMHHIESIDASERVALVEAGCTLEALQDAAALHALEPGIDLAARGSATLGGMVSTNAGGVMAFRNGVMRHRVLGLEAVLPDGTVYEDLTRVVKNSAGYDLKHLFIGAEGTLGIVTRVVIKLDPLPQATATALFGLPSVEATLAVIGLALQAKAGHLRAAEALWQRYMALNANALQWRQDGFALDQPIYLLLKLGGSDEASLQAAFAQVFEDALVRYSHCTGIIASSARQEAELWHLREDTDNLYRAHPNAPSYDVSVPLSSIATYAAQVQAELTALDATLAPYIFGHLADGNLHIILNQTGPLTVQREQEVEHILYRNLRALGGSFSAEHGVGSKRIGAMIDTTGAAKLHAMRQLKQLLDPANLMNPGKLFQD
jgi:FAD/FMN-containing dehydrogenase